jgi:hypothetical protein
MLGGTWFAQAGGGGIIVGVGEMMGLVLFDDPREKALYRCLGE